jgi:hypothetical protein
MGLEFDDEPASDRLNPVDCLNHLLLVWAIGYTEHSPTKYTVPGKNSDVIHVDVVNLDEQDESGAMGKVHRNCWWRNGRLIGFLRPRIGREKPVLAWMTLGTATMGKPPYELMVATAHPESVARASAWIAAHPDFGPQQGHITANRPLEEVDTSTPAPRQPSQLEMLAAQQSGNLRQAMGRPPLPPAQPTIAGGPMSPQAYNETPPF